MTCHGILPQSFSRIVRRLLLLCLCLACTPLVQAEGLRVIAPRESGLEQLDSKQVGDIFLSRLASDSSLRPVDMKDQALRALFYEHITGKSLSGIKAYWARRVFTGRGRPPAMMTLEEVHALIAGKAPVITYIPMETTIPQGFVSLYEFERGAIR